MEAVFSHQVLILYFLRKSDRTYFTENLFTLYTYIDNESTTVCRLAHYARSLSITSFLLECIL